MGTVGGPATSSRRSSPRSSGLSPAVTPYRSPVEFDDRLLRSAASGLRRLDTFSARLRDDEEHGPHAFEVDDVRDALLGVLAPARETAEEDARVTAE